MSATLAFAFPRISECAACGRHRLMASGFAVCEECLTPERLEAYRQHARDAQDADLENTDRYLAAEECRWCPKRMEPRAEEGRRRTRCVHHTRGV